MFFNFWLYFNFYYRILKHRSLQAKPSEIIIIHNLKELESQEIADHVWQREVSLLCGGGSFILSKVIAENPLTGKMQEKHVTW